MNPFIFDSNSWKRGEVYSVPGCILNWTGNRGGDKMNVREIKQEAAKRIVEELCKHSIYKMNSGTAISVVDALGRMLSQRKLNHVFDLVVLGKK